MTYRVEVLVPAEDFGGFLRTLEAMRRALIEDGWPSWLVRGSRGSDPRPGRAKAAPTLTIETEVELE